MRIALGTTVTYQVCARDIEEPDATMYPVSSAYLYPQSAQDIADSYNEVEAEIEHESDDIKYEYVVVKVTTQTEILEKEEV